MIGVIASVVKVGLFSGPKIPIGLTVAALGALWLYKDATWAIEARARVNSAVKEVVAGAEIAALEAKLEAAELVEADLRLTAKAKQQLIDAQRGSLEQYRLQLAQANVEVQNRDDEIDEILAGIPAPQEGDNSCLPPPGLLERLRDG